MPRYGNNVDLVQNELQNARVQNLSADPGSPVVGQIWFNTTADVLKVRTGAGTISLGAGSSDASTLNGQAGSYYLARGNHTGTQTASTISDLATVVQAYRLDQFAAPTASVSFGSQRITNLSDPSGAQDAATKNYVDGLVQGITGAKAPVKAVATSNITISNPGTLTYDGVTCAAGDRVLLIAQSTGSQNGIYIVGATAATALVRATDADGASADSELRAGTLVPVDQGTTYADSVFILATNGAITIGTTALTFTKLFTIADLQAGNGLTKSAQTLNVGPGTGIVVNADDVAIDTSLVPRKFAQTIGDGSATQFDLTHNFGSRDVLVSVYQAASPWAQVIPDVEALSTTQVRIKFSTAPTSNQYRVVVQG